MRYFKEKKFKARWAELKGDRDISISDSPELNVIRGTEIYDGYRIMVESEDLEGIILNLDKAKMEILKEKEMTTESTKRYKLAKLENGKEYITCTYEEIHGSGVYTLYYNSIKDVIEVIDIVSKTTETIIPVNGPRAPRKAINIFGPEN